MRIVFDVSPLSHQRAGIGNYIRGSLGGLARAAAGRHEIVAFAPTSPQGLRTIPAALAGIDVDVKLTFLPFAHHWRMAWSRLGRPALERVLGRFDVLHFSDWMFPPQSGGVRATTVHDLVPLRFPQWTTARTRSMHGAKYRNMVETCHVMYANSRFTAADVVELLGVDSARVRVASPSVAPEFVADGERATLGRPYVLTVATLEPRKNLDTLARAYRLLDTGHALAVAGGEGWGAQPDLHAEGLLRLGYVDDARLATLYRGADVFVYPSRFEGFGIPILEAMSCGVPVVASSHPSMDEACGDAAVRVDPADPAAIAEGIERALDDRFSLVERGFAHARRFDWDDVGRIFLEGYEAAR